MAAMMESDDDEDGGADFGAIGFMFDAETSRSERRFSFPIGGAAPAPAPAPAPAVGEEASLLEVRLMCIDDDPGFVQSGHYIRPAASTMATFLAAHWDRDYPADASRPLPTVVELGAGCGLAGLAAAPRSVRGGLHRPRPQDPRPHSRERRHAAGGSGEQYW